MHRARVTETRGKKALAEGKWLTVIGNRSVHSGDWVWTDGRCIYGHESAGGSAPVIGGSGGCGIPIYRDAHHIYVYQRGELRQLRLHSDRLAEGLLYFDAYTACFLPYFPEPKIVERLLDADMDAAGNVFTLTGARWFAKHTHAFLQSGDLCVARVEKNGKRMFSCNFRPYITKQQAHLKTNPPYLMWVQAGGGHVDCEGNWGFYMEIDTLARGENIDEALSTMYYVSPSGGHRLLQIYGIVPREDPKSRRIVEDYTGAKAAKFPIHDGYYYIWEEHKPSTRVLSNLPEFAVLTLFTPEGKQIITDCFPVGAHFTILNIGQDRYLLNVKSHPMTLCILFPIQYLEVPWSSDWVSDGVYLCENGVLQKRISGECFQFRLRQVQNIKTWEKTLKNAIQGGRE